MFETKHNSSEIKVSDEFPVSAIKHEFLIDKHNLAFIFDYHTVYHQINTSAKFGELKVQY